MDDSKKNSVLIVDDENPNIMALTHILGPEYTVYQVKNGQETVETAEKYLPDVILLDVIMPEIDGYSVIKELKNNEKTRDIPVIIVAGQKNVDDEEKGLALGASDYIIKPFSPAIVRMRVRNQIKLLNQLRMIELLSLLDQLTSIPNRRGLDNRMDMEWIRAIRENTSLSFLLMDVDNFKSYNDNFGHQQGDRVLQSVAKTIAQSLSRPGDYAARWGGEEFAVLLPNTDLSGALIIAEKIRNNISSMGISCMDGEETKVTISIGVNTKIPQRANSLTEFIADADKALYRAKENGKNRVCQAADLQT
jgi:diguanylate cyclase (GGDEF)-like protein